MPSAGSIPWRRPSGTLAALLRIDTAEASNRPRVISEQVPHNQTERTHTGAGESAAPEVGSAEPGQPLDTSQIVCRERLGKLLKKHYERRAA